jgi:hypothetical protein
VERLTTEDKTETRSGFRIPDPEAYGLDVRHLVGLV